MKRKITIVEDDDDLRSLMRLSLESAGYEISSYDNAASMTSGRHYGSDLYIIDLNLGGISGLDLCKQMKRKSADRPLPKVIIISANPDVRSLAMEVCADDALSKPFTSRDLVNKIQQHVRNVG